jgi:DNA processing protein
VSGLSDAVVVVESGLKGGAMITAGLAGEQGRPLFAVPGRIDQPTSAGCHRLIREGASLLTCAGEVLEELAYLGGRRPRSIPSAPAGRPGAVADLTGDEIRVLECLRGGESLTGDALAERTGWGAGRVAAALLLLEMKGRAARRLDGAYEEAG